MYVFLEKYILIPQTHLFSPINQICYYSFSSQTTLQYTFTTIIMQYFKGLTLHPSSLKFRLLTSTLEMVLVYGSETWSLSNEYQPERACLKWAAMLRPTKDVNQNSARRLRPAGYCSWHPVEDASDIVLRVPDCRSKARRCPTGRFIDMLKMDSGLELQWLYSSMLDRNNGWWFWLKDDDSL